jgi:hypothetical protein
MTHVIYTVKSPKDGKLIAKIFTENLQFISVVADNKDFQEAILGWVSEGIISLGEKKFFVRIYKEEGQVFWDALEKRLSKTFGFNLTKETKDIGA